MDERPPPLESEYLIKSSRPCYKKNTVKLCISVILIVIALIVIIILGVYFGVIKKEKPQPTFIKPIILTTWNFFNATKSGYLSMVSSESSLDAVEIAGSFCEYNPNECDFSVGFGGSPSEISTSTIDAMIMNGNTM